ncbi:phage tail tape measure protein [Fusobacterium periodonticum]|uniref:phage tail tape measure protein n=1 Tax=Fusobacterium periodonticum TaxID=860 RepID=UPI001A603B3B|nr:phage tail tape measure protein [Fusobacterium periodonticum]VTX73389.1 Phage-related minor tail protein [Fusobacterium periodonticum]
MEHVLSATLELKDKFSSKIKSASKELGSFSKNAISAKGAVKETADCIKSSFENLKNLAIGFGAFKGVMAVFDFVKDAYTGYAKLDAAITRNRGIMRASIEDTAKLKSQVLELGKTMPFTAQEVAEAQYYQAMAGMKTNEVLEMTPKLLKMSIASGQDLASTSDILTDNISSFGLALEDADRLMDVMVATANNANTDIAGLGEAYKYVASTSKSFESMEEVNILLGTLANNGIKSGQAGRNLAAVYTRLAKSTPDIDKALKVINLKLYDSQGKFKGLRKIVEEMRPILARMTDEQRNYILTTIFGSEQMKIITSLLGTSKESFESLANSIYNSKGATEEFNKLQENTPEYKIKALASAWDNLKLHIGEAAAPAITSLIENLTGKIIELTESDTFSKENVQAFFDTVIGYLNTTIDLVSDLATLLEPVIWGLKVVGKTAEIGKNIGSYFMTNKSIKQNNLESEIIENNNKIWQMRPETKEEEEKRKKLFIKNEQKKQEYWKEYGERIELKAKNGDPHAIKDLVYKPLGNSIEEITEAYDMMYQKTKEKIDGLASQVGVPLRDTTNSQSQYIKTKEKINDVIGIKPIRDTKLNDTFSPEVNIEADKNKILETKKEDIPTISPIINLKNDKDKFINNKILNPQVKDVSNKKEEPKKEIIKTATPSYDKLTSKLISAFEEQRKNVKTVVENKTLNYIAKPSEKIRVPEVKQGNNDIKVPPQNVTFSPQINLNMGGVVIKNEADVEKVAELSKQKIMKNLMTYVQTTN